MPKDADSGVQGLFFYILSNGMSKMKTNRGAAKRFSKTGKGGYKRSQAHLNHILTKKKSKRKRQLGEMLEVHDSDVRMVRRMLPYT